VKFSIEGLVFRIEDGDLELILLVECLQMVNLSF
jgi:hypothetical protein